MKKSTFWKLGISTALAFGLSACSTTSSSEEDILDNESSSSDNGSSNSKNASSSSGRRDVSCDTLKNTLAAPTDLNVVKSGDDKWVLIWSYTNNDSRPEDGFIIQVLNMADSVPSWKDMDETEQAVTMYNLEGKDKASKYYRIVAKDDCGESKPTSMVQVTTAGSGSTSASTDLAVPTDLKLDTLKDNQWQLSWSYKDNANRPENGFKVQTLNLNDKSPTWKDEATTNKGVHVIKIDGTKKGGLLYHVAAKDTNGFSEYSEEILIPSMPDASDLDDNSASALAVPTDLKLDSLGNNQWKLSWSYTDNSARPENGFQLQVLNLNTESPSWKDSQTTNKGVRYIILDATKLGGQYVKVAAKDANGTSKYSSEVMVPNEVKAGAVVTDESVTMPVPTNLQLDSIAPNKYRLSWSYANNEKRPENGFRLQKLDLSKTPITWSKYGETAKGVNHYIITNSATDVNEIFIQVAAKDGNDSLSQYSAEIVIPKYIDYSAEHIKTSMPAPTNLKLDTLGYGEYQLSWDYDDYADNGFILQKLDLNSTSKEWVWDESKITKKGVRLIILEAAEDGGKLFRVAAFGGAGRTDTSIVSTAVSIPRLNVDGTIDEGTVTASLNIPTDLKVTDIGGNKYRLSWSYTNVSARPENGFTLQKLDASAEDIEWEEDKALKTNKGVNFIDITAADNDISYRVAAQDSKGISEWSNTVTVPKKFVVAPKNGCVGEFAKPINFKAERVAPNAWRLIWDYNRNTECVEEGFVVQQLDVTGAARDWKDLDSTDINVQYYNLEGIKNLNQYYRVAAKRGSHRTEFSSDVKITRLIAYSADVPFKTPTVKARIYYHFKDYFKKDDFDQSTGDVLPDHKAYTLYPHYFDYETIVNEGFPNHAIVYYKNTVNLEYQFRWNNEEYEDWKTIAITDTTDIIHNEYQTLVLRHLDDNVPPEGKDEITDNYRASKLCHHYSQARIIWTVKDGDEVVKDTTDWSEPVGPLYNAKNPFEYLEAPEQSEDCEALFPKDHPLVENGTYKNTAMYKSCTYYQPLGYKPCQTN